MKKVEKVDQKRWHALYVKSRYERKVLKQLEDMGVESYLPLITRIRQWSDRKKQIEEPLFKSYIFVRNDARQHVPILQLYGVVKFVTFNHEVAVVPESQIVAIRRYIDNPVEEEELTKNTDLRKGQLVRITNGPMQGLTGRLIDISNKRRLIVHIEAVGQSIPVSIPRAKVEPVIQTKEEIKPIDYQKV